MAGFKFLSPDCIDCKSGLDGVPVCVSNFSSELCLSGSFLGRVNTGGGGAVASGGGGGGGGAGGGGGGAGGGGATLDSANTGEGGLSAEVSPGGGPPLT